MTASVVRFFSTVIGAGVSGSAFVYAAHGSISWWLVAGIYAWVLSIAAVVMA